MIELASHIIDRKKTKFDPSKFEDKYEDALLALIKAKKAGKKAPAANAPPKPSNVINLFDALKKSLNADDGSKASSATSSGRTRKAKVVEPQSAERARRRPSRSTGSRHKPWPASSNIMPSAISARPASRAASKGRAAAKSAGRHLCRPEARCDASALRFPAGA